jgi:hypothetical protein
MLLSHKIDNVKFTHSGNNSQHELFCCDLLLNFLKRLVAGYTPFCRLTKLRSGPTVTTSDRSSKLTFLFGFANRQQLSASIHPNVLSTDFVTTLYCLARTTGIVKCCTTSQVEEDSVLWTNCECPEEKSQHDDLLPIKL